MTDHPIERVEAEGLLHLARQRMTANYPFHAALLGEGRFEAADITTMAVTIRGDRVTILYAPAFVLQCSIAELTGVIHHELNHILFGHLFDDPASFPDKDALIISQEVTVNEWVTEPLPCQPITLDQYPGLPPREDTKQRYRRLARADAKRPHPVPKSGRPVPKNARPCTGNPAGDSRKSPSVQPLDDHSVWEEVRKSPRLARMAAAVAVRAARKNLTSDKLSKIPDELQRQIDQWSAGSASGRSEEQLGAFGGWHAGIDWRRLLRQHVGRVLEIRAVFNRPPRRFPEFVGILPGRGRRSAKPRILAVIDTSGSLDVDSFRRISLELARLALSREVVVAECDAKIQRVYKYRDPIQRVKGRGGTDFRPVFDTAFLRTQKPDLVIYFTDGEGPAPSQRPAIPVIWCLTEAGRKPAPWGDVISMHAS